MRVDDDIPFEVAALAGCGVPTGWGSSVYAAGVAAGDTVVIFGAGGVGTNAVQGARYAGARYIMVVDPVEFKRENAMEFGATDLAQRAERVCEGHPWYVPGALATWTANVTDALHDLVAETMPQPAGGFWFVDGDGRRLRPVPSS